MVSAELTLPESLRELAYVICGCATTENTWGAIIAELEHLDLEGFKAEDDLASALCDHFGLSEHGTSIRSGWLTDAGREALAFLRKYGHDWKHKGEFIDSEGVHHGMVG